MTGSSAPVTTDVIDHVLRITLNRPEARNAMTIEMAGLIAEALDELDRDPGLRAAVISGAGETFSAGADLKQLALGRSATAPGRGFAGFVERPPRKPLIAAVEGWALGGGFEMVLACDLVVCGVSARFGLPEVKRGLVARAGGAIRLPRRLPRAIALEILLTGEPLTAERAERFGLVNVVLPDGQAQAEAMRLARMVATNAPLAIAATKKIADESLEWAVSDWFDNQRKITDPVFSSSDAAEGTQAFAEKRAPRWTNS